MSMTMSSKFTPTERRLLEALSDGMMHAKAELMGCLSDELSSKSNLTFHMANLRKKLRSEGTDIVCQVYRGGYYYRHMRILAPSDE